MKNNSQEYYKFLGKLYDILLNEGIIKYGDQAKDLKEKKLRIEKYLDKLKRIQDKVSDNERHLETLKKLYYDRYVIKEEDIPNGYFKFLENQYLEQGYGHINLVNPVTSTERELKQQHIDTIINEQKDSLNNWLNYFFSEDSSYMEMWAKVWAFQGMLHIGNLNKNKDGYDTRSETTVNPFVSIDSEILNQCVSLVQETFNKKETTDEMLNKLLSSGSFPKLYGKLLASKKQIKAEINEGIWIKYNKETETTIKEKNSKGYEPEYIKLYNSLQGYNTGWCTAGSRETAKKQILGGDFYVYYSKDENGDYKIPRLAIRMENNLIGEIRGIAENQNVESNMEYILDEKLKEFPDAEKYKKKVSDMKKLTQIYNKHINKESLTKEELRFLYEIEEKISGFGYYTDPRVKEIIKTRNKLEDLMIVCECDRDQIILDGDFDKLQKSEKKIKYFSGDLDLNSLTNAESLKLPEIIHGSLYLRSLTTAECLKLPEIINGNLSLRSLSNAEGLKLPETINGYLYLNKLTNAEGMKFPKTINGFLNLNSLTNAEGLDLSNTTINGPIDLNDLISAKDLKLPETINGYLSLNRLTHAEGLKLPKTINGFLNLNSLTNAECLDLSNTTINGSLSLNKLTSAEGLKLPETVDGGLYLNSLTSAEGLKLPETINGYLYLNNLISLKNVVLPQVVTDKIYIYEAYYSLEKVKEMQKQEELGKKKTLLKNSGLVSISFLISTIFLLGIIIFLICSSFIK